MTAATKTTRRPAAKKAAAPAPAPAPAKKSHRQLAADAVTVWQQENQQALTLVAHLSGTATAGSVWKVTAEDGTARRAQFTAKAGKLVLTGFEEKPAGAKTTRDEVAAEAAKLGAYEVVMHSQGSIWTVKNPEGTLFSFDRKAGTVTEKPAKKTAAAAK